jgi:signal transduction histidine kinase
MDSLTDSELIKGLKERFQEKDRALYDIRQLTRKIEKVNKKLQESESLKSNFLSNIRNEINNPLTSIMGLAKQIALSGGALNCETAVAISNMIHSEAFDLDFQLKNIFAAADIEAGEAELCISNVSIGSLIRNRIESYSHRADEKKLSVRFTGNCADDREGEIFFKTDPEKLNLIFSNLLSNAIEFSSEGGEVEVNLYIDDEHLNIVLKNNGIMVDKPDLEAIFDRFRQLDTGVKKSHRGHGLGLSVTQSLIEFLNGTITVSSNQGEGSIFTSTIPEAESDGEVDIFSVDSNEFIFEEKKL